MKKTNLADFGDLLNHSEKLGYFWNQAHTILVNDGIPPEAECNKIEYYMDDITSDCYDWSEDTKKIIKTFMEVNGVTEFTLTR